VLLLLVSRIDVWMGVIVSGGKRVGVVQQFERWTWFALPCSLKSNAAGRGHAKMAISEVYHFTSVVEGSSSVNI
jgi:hypothetical protein